MRPVIINSRIIKKYPDHESGHLHEYMYLNFGIHTYRRRSENRLHETKISGSIIQTISARKEKEPRIISRDLGSQSPRRTNDYNIDNEGVSNKQINNNMGEDIPSFLKTYHKSKQFDIQGEKVKEKNLEPYFKAKYKLISECVGDPIMTDFFDNQQQIIQKVTKKQEKNKKIKIKQDENSFFSPNEKFQVQPKYIQEYLQKFHEINKDIDQKVYQEYRDLVKNKLREEDQQRAAQLFQTLQDNKPIPRSNGGSPKADHTKTAHNSLKTLQFSPNKNNNCDKNSFSRAVSPSLSLRKAKTCKLLLRNNNLITNKEWLAYTIKKISLSLNDSKIIQQIDNGNNNNDKFTEPMAEKTKNLILSIASARQLTTAKNSKVLDSEFKKLDSLFNSPLVTTSSSNQKRNSRSSNSRLVKSNSKHFNFPLITNSSEISDHCTPNKKGNVVSTANSRDPSHSKANPGSSTNANGSSTMEIPMNLSNEKNYKQLYESSQEVKENEDLLAKIANQNNKTKMPKLLHSSKSVEENILPKPFNQSKNFYQRYQHNRNDAKDFKEKLNLTRNKSLTFITSIVKPRKPKPFIVPNEAIQINNQTANNYI